jgi:hypothetical protein
MAVILLLAVFRLLAAARERMPTARAEIPGGLAAEQHYGVLVFFQAVQARLVREKMEARIQHCLALAAEEAAAQGQPAVMRVAVSQVTEEMVWSHI